MDDFGSWVYALSDEVLFDFLDIGSGDPGRRRHFHGELVEEQGILPLKRANTLTGIMDFLVKRGPKILFALSFFERDPPTRSKAF